MNEIEKLTQQDIPNLPQNADGLIVRLSKEHRKKILGLTDGVKYYIPSVIHAQGTNIFFVVGLEEAMPDDEECLEIKKHGLLLALVVTEKDIIALDQKQIDNLSFNIVNTKNSNQITFMVEVRRLEDKGDD